MKIGIRVPSIKKSVKARTTGRAKRAVKSSVNPLYGKKGMGWVKNPKKAAYNAVYHRTSVGLLDLSKNERQAPPKRLTPKQEQEVVAYMEEKKKQCTPCKLILPSGFQYCPMCGGPVIERASLSHTPPYEPPPERNWRNER